MCEKETNGVRIILGEKGLKPGKCLERKEGALTTQKGVTVIESRKNLLD